MGFPRVFPMVLPKLCLSFGFFSFRPCFPWPGTAEAFVKARSFVGWWAKMALLARNRPC